VADRPGFQGRAPVRLSLAAPAKINLFLHVTGRREDGYHLLESLVVFAETGDRLIVERSEDLSLAVTGPFAAGLANAGPDNLVLRAAAALQRKASVQSGATIRLEKNLPVSSGIGGGSADAAAALRVLSVLWNIDPENSDLASVGLAIGADVPVCLNARSAIMSGVGETILDVAPPPPCGVVLVNAGEGVSTPGVFAARTAPFTDSGDWQTPRTFDAFIDALNIRKNDLSGPALSVSPVIGDVLAALSGTGECALARLSGSGGTCFGLYPDDVSAGSAATAIRAEHPDWWCVATSFRDQVPSIDPV
jgi:4-diphosphocytidyl-2-C-methyl-D-erythritol kinase